MLEATVLTCTPRSLFIGLKGDGTREEFRQFVEREMIKRNAHLAHGDTMEKVLTKEGDCYTAVLECNPINKRQNE